MIQSDTTDLLYTRFFEAEYLLREMAQYERVLLDSANDPPEDENSDDTLTLEEVREEYHIQNHYWWYLRMQLPADSAARGLDLWRSHPR